MGVKRAGMPGVLAGLALGFLVGCATTPSKPQSQVQGAESCVPADRLELQVAPEAALTELSCTVKPYKKVQSLHIKVGIRNTTDSPHRYRVNLFLDNGKAVGGLIPRKGKPPVVKPGETATFTYPVKGMAEKPKGLTVVVKTIGE